MSVRKLSVKKLFRLGCFGTDKPQREGNMETEIKSGLIFNMTLKSLTAIIGKS